MHRPFRIRFFVHSLVSDWDNGKAHFLRGLTRALARMGHEVRAFEELGGWSLRNLVHHEKDRSIDAIDNFRRVYPELDIHFYRNDSSFAQFAEEQLRDIDVVIVHERNEPTIVNQVLALKSRYGFKALFHDTHHLACTNAGQLLRFHMHLFDGVLAFGEPIRRIYADGFGIEKTWTLHEAVDTEVFRPLQLKKNTDVVWVGNWKDGDRARDLGEFLIEPARVSGSRVVTYGCQYPDAVIGQLTNAGIEHRGYLPNLNMPEVYAQSLLALHIPHKQGGGSMGGGLFSIATIRVFEAMACGATLLCAPWQDEEKLFHPGRDYVVAENGLKMGDMMKELLADDRARHQIGEHGLATVLAHHTCAHRAQQLTEIMEHLAIS